MSKNKEKQQKSLGFIFGYKESSSHKDENGQTIFNISFKRGVSKKIPTKFKNCKDFWCEEIFVGQSSDIYIKPTYFKEVFNKKLNEINEDLKRGEHSFYNETYNQRKYYFDYPITIEQFSALNSFSMAHLYTTYQNWENEYILSQSLKECVGDFFKNEKSSLLDIYRKYKTVSEYIYKKEIEKSLGFTESTKTKLKP